MSYKKTLNYYGRFKDTPWFDELSQARVTVFGAGGIGSWLALFLARTGAEVVVVDMDTVEDHNIAGQLYGKQDVGKPKVSAVKDVIDRLCGENNINILNEEVSIDKKGVWKRMITLSDVVCTTFDSIRARQIVYNNWLADHKEVSLFVDGRMSIENGQVFTVHSQDDQEVFKHYESSFFDDLSVPQAPCTLKATSHCGAMIASLMVSQITNYFTNYNPENMEREISNQLDFNLPLLLFDSLNVTQKHGITT